MELQWALALCDFFFAIRSLRKVNFRVKWICISKRKSRLTKTYLCSTSQWVLVTTSYSKWQIGSASGMGCTNKPRFPWCPPPYAASASASASASACTEATKRANKHTTFCEKLKTKKKKSKSKDPICYFSPFGYKFLHKKKLLKTPRLEISHIYITWNLAIAWIIGRQVEGNWDKY